MLVWQFERFFGYMQLSAPLLICTCVSQFHNVRFISGWFLPARRYASAGTSYGPVSVCLSVRVCLSQVGVLSKRMNDPSWVFLHGGFFGPILHYVEIQISTTMSILSSVGRCPKLRTLKNFTTSYRSSKRVINLARERWRPSDKLGRRRSTKLTLPPSSDARPL